MVLCGWGLQAPQPCSALSGMSPWSLSQQNEQIGMPCGSWQLRKGLRGWRALGKVRLGIDLN